jgi:hypothetical protein
MECFRAESTRMDSFRRKKKTERKKESGKKRDKSDGKKAKIGPVLYTGEGFSFRPFRILRHIPRPSLYLRRVWCNF